MRDIALYMWAMPNSCRGWQSGTVIDKDQALKERLVRVDIPV
jgi:hypothetical protein